MMIEKMVKVRKIHLCTECADEISVGDKALFLKMKLPKLNKDNETQVGIEYCTDYFCEKCLKLWEETT